MAYLAKSKRKNKTYYYLVENLKLATGERKQIRQYLGNQHPSERSLQALLAEFEKKIEEEKSRLYGFHYLTRPEIGQVDSVNSEFWKRYRAENPTVQEQFDQNFVMAFVYNTNSIEGSTLTPKEVELLLSEDIAPNKPLEDVLEAKACQKTLQFVKAYKKDLSEKFLLEIHQRYFSDTKPFIAGKYKTKTNYIRGSDFKLAEPHEVPREMKKFIGDYKKLKQKLHPLELAAWAHWKIVAIHPFQDGNGRTARLAMNFVLHKNKYPMIDTKTKEKKTYFKALEKCSYSQNGAPLAKRLVRHFKKQYQNALK